ncbi:MAG: HlyD family efflux transporter periplasmic adaptor subunit [Anaerolineae bacterium]|nr:HlyD family efflux transporter periplasmic adaptor subunit [Anaerolineae bacterium]
MRRLIVIVVILVFATGAVLLLRQQEGANPTAPNIRTSIIDRGTLTLSINANGTIAPQKQVRLSFSAPGIVSEISVQEGQQVQAGDVLAKQNSTAQQLSVEQAKANLNVAELSLKRLTAPLDPRDLEVAEAQVKAAEGAYNALFSAISPSTIRAAEAQYNQAVTAYQGAIQHRKDVGGQYPTDSIPYQIALAQEGQASFSAEIARLQVQLLRRGPDARAVAAAKAQIEAANARVEQLKAGPTQAQIDQAQIAIDQAQNAVTQAQDSLTSTILTAPFDGIVSLIAIREGTLSSNTPAITLIDTAAFHVDVQVDEIDIGQLREALPVTLTLDALPDAMLIGSVAHIALVANQTGTVTTYDVRITLDPTIAAIKVGMTANANIIVRELTEVVRVPNIFVRLDRRLNQAFVNLVAANGTLVETPITLGLRTEEYSEVISGLQEGDVIGIDLNAGGFSLFGS